MQIFNQIEDFKAVVCENMFIDIWNIVLEVLYLKYQKYFKSKL